MYNRTTCLSISRKIYRKILTQSSHENISSRETDRSANTHYWSNVARKQSYCQIATNESDQTNNNAINDVQQRLDEILVNSENEKLLQVLKSDMQHNVERIPEKLRPIDCLTLSKLTSKAQRR